MVRSDLPAPVAARLREVLLEAADDPRGSAALREFFGTSGFYPVDQAAQKRLDQLRAGVARVKLEVE
jgi:phosphonate transport system substrate-binding protein